VSVSIALLTRKNMSYLRVILLHMIFDIGSQHYLLNDPGSRPIFLVVEVSSEGPSNSTIP
jgi:hypothetical protein